MASEDRAAGNASKFGLAGQTRTLAAERGGGGVRVNAYCPAWEKTEMNGSDQAGGGLIDTDFTERAAMGRFARPEDVERAEAFLDEERESGLVNGARLAVDEVRVRSGSQVAPVEQAVKGREQNSRGLKTCLVRSMSVWGSSPNETFER